MARHCWPNQGGKIQTAAELKKIFRKKAVQFRASTYTQLKNIRRQISANLRTERLQDVRNRDRPQATLHDLFPE
jgi:hypothetical protein